MLTVAGEDDCWWLKGLFGLMDHPVQRQGWCSWRKMMAMEGLSMLSSLYFYFSGFPSPFYSLSVFWSLLLLAKQ
jgi:hypothetical protein